MGWKGNFKPIFTTDVIKLFPLFVLGQNYTLESFVVDVAQLVRALDCGSRGRGFKSPHPPLKAILVTLLFMLGCDKTSHGPINTLILFE